MGLSIVRWKSNNYTLLNIVLLFQYSYRFCRFIPIHYWHRYIHKNNFIVHLTTAFLSLHLAEYQVYSFLSIVSLLKYKDQNTYKITLNVKHHFKYVLERENIKIIVINNEDLVTLTSLLIRKKNGNISFNC